MAAPGTSLESLTAVLDVTAAMCPSQHGLPDPEVCATAVAPLLFPPSSQLQILVEFLLRPGIAPRTSKFSVLAACVLLCWHTWWCLKNATMFSRISHEENHAPCPKNLGSHGDSHYLHAQDLEWPRLGSIWQLQYSSPEIFFNFHFLSQVCVLVRNSNLCI